MSNFFRGKRVIDQQMARATGQVTQAVNRVARATGRVARAVNRVARAACLPVMLALSLACTPALAWPGYQFDDWQQLTTWSQPKLESDQMGRHDLAPMLEGPDGSPINEIQAWEAKRTATLSMLRAILGQPTDLERPKPEIEILKTEELADHTRRHIRIRSEKSDWIPAYLLLPKPLPKMPLPAMICVHQTVAQGKEEPCGIKGSQDLAFALQLVRRGMVCIAPDMIGFGERIPKGSQPYHDSMAFYKKHPGWSFMGKMVWDMSRVVDALETLPEVDPLQIGSIGHSHGAYTTLFTAALEPRIALAIASCGFTTFRSDPAPNRWSHLTALIPQLGTWLPEVETIPFDWQHICSAIAPRSLFVWYGLHDTVFPNTDNLDPLLQDVRGVYGLYGAADDLSWHAFDGAHGFPPQGRQLAYPWMEERLFPVGQLHSVPASSDTWEEQRSVIGRVIRRSLGPIDATLPAPHVETISIENLKGIERRLIEYSVTPEADTPKAGTPKADIPKADIPKADIPKERVRAYLSIPSANQSARDHSLPAILVLHQTSAEGKRESAGIAGDRSLAFADDLARRGYITLAPDSITAGERIDQFGPFDTRGHYLSHPNQSAMGRMVQDSMVAINVLSAADQVDPNRIGVIGHSLGAEEALMLAAFDQRIRATVASCGYSTFAAEPKRLRWARDRWFSYMPKLRPVFQNGQVPHWDWGDVIRMVAPRAFYQQTTRADTIFPESESAHEAAEAARPIWKLHNQPDRLRCVLNPGGHAVSNSARQDIYEWLDQQLRQE